MEKLRYRCFADTQILSHVREKKYMLEGTEDDELQELKDVLVEMDMTRSFMHDCNAKCEKLRKLYAETSTNCGLLDKPELLRNFDDTKNEFKATKENIQRIRCELEAINKNISSLMGVLRELKDDSKSSVVRQSKEESRRTSANATPKLNCIPLSTLQIHPYLKEDEN